MDRHDVKREAAQGLRPPGARGRRPGGIRRQRCCCTSLIGWIALQVACGAAAASTPTRAGRWQSLAGNGAGQAALWVGVLGFLGLVCGRSPTPSWATPATTRTPGAGAPRRSARPSSTSPWPGPPSGSRAASRATASSQSVDFTSSLMDKPGGRGWSVVIGLVIIGVGVYHVCKGATESSSGTSQKQPGHLGHPRRGSSATSPRASPWRSWAPCSSPPACTASQGGLRPRRRAAHAAGAALRPGTAHPGGRRFRGLRPLQLQPGQARQGLTRPAGRVRPARARPDPAYRRRHAEGRRGHLSALLLGPCCCAPRGARG